MFSRKFITFGVFFSVLAALCAEAANMKQENGSVTWGHRQRGTFRATHDGDVAENCEAVFVIGVGTAMRTEAYDYLAQSVSRGAPIVTVFFDHNPGNIVKLGAWRYAGFYEAFTADLETLVPVCAGKSPTILAGGHSASGQAGLNAMSSNPSVRPDGFVGLSPFRVLASATVIDPSLPVLTWGFTKTTCGVDPEQASEAEYDLSGKTNRVLFRADNNEGSSDVGHCSFTDGGCLPGILIPGCPSPKTTDLKDVVARSMRVFATSIGRGRIEPEDFGFDTSNPAADIAVFVNDDEPSPIATTIGGVGATGEPKKWLRTKTEKQLTWFWEDMKG